MNTPRAIALCQCFNGALEFQAGHWSEAEAALRESIRLHHDLGAASGEALAWQRLGVLQTARGQFDEAMASFEEGVVVAERATMRAHCLTRLYASAARNQLIVGDLQSADQYLALGLAMGERHGNCATCDSLLLPVVVSLRLAQNDFASAETFCRKLEDASRKYNSRIWIAMARQTRAEYMGAQGKFDEALTFYLEAQESFMAAGNEYEAVRCLQAIASLRQSRRAPGDVEEASTISVTVQQVFTRLGIKA